MHIDRLGIAPVVYDAIAADPDPEVRMLLAESWYAPGAQRARLSDDPDIRVRRALAEGPRPFRTHIDPLPSHAFTMLCGDSDPQVRAVAAAKGWEAQPAVLRTIVNASDRYAYLWSKALATARLEPETLDQLRHRSFPFLLRLAENPHLPTELLELLATDSNPAVRLAVSMRYGLTTQARRAIDHRVLPHDAIFPAFWASTSESDRFRNRIPAEDRA
ncbi:hypothetical protein [Nocardia sp. NPDC056100]|uniref:hypothetical protein n=1 Tax=Nocardia sp. NPDC056100 TaxID=3345712 RepID=UPI0035D61A4C